MLIGRQLLELSVSEGAALIVWGILGMRFGFQGPDCGERDGLGRALQRSLMSLKFFCRVAEYSSPDFHKCLFSGAHSHAVDWLAKALGGTGVNSLGSFTLV